VANSNRQTDNRKAKLRRRRREVDRLIAKLQTAAGASSPAAGGKTVDTARKIRTLKTAMRYWGGDCARA
jgi:hypothetical protein